MRSSYTNNEKDTKRTVSSAIYWLLLLKMPDGKFLNWLLFNRLSNCMVYDDNIKENKNARQKVVTSFLMF